MQVVTKVVASMVLSMGISTISLAKDCGEPPIDSPSLPTASTLDTSKIRSARDKVVRYSKDVDRYMTCMDQRGRKLLPYLSKEQQARWEEDLTKLHETRRQIQISLNDLIRAYRKRNNS